MQLRFVPSCLAVILVFGCLLSLSGASKVVELSDRFIDIINEESSWLIMFYAPWCAHCKRLEPIWAHVAQNLARVSSIRVGKLDCTVHTNTCRKFNVRMYPTIMFIKGTDIHFTFQGDRNTEDIINFALRVSGPPVLKITKSKSIEELKNKNQVFFLYVGPPDTNHPLYVNISIIIIVFFFFHPDVKFKKPTTHSFRSISGPVIGHPEEDIQSNLTQWINTERFETFMKVTSNNIDDFLSTNKYLVLAVVEENKLKQVPSHMIHFRSMIHNIIKQHRSKYHRHFQFGWIGSPELANRIAMQYLSLPHLIVLNSTTNHHHIPEDEPLQLTHEAVVMFLDSVLNQSAQVYGGNNVGTKLYRMYFDTASSLSDMWRGNPVLMTVLLIVPSMFLLLILYSICCGNILDADEDEEDDCGYSTDNEYHEKKE
ncbi:protein disulfide-isomerase TMX3 [Diaphorina citri]|uniref:Protein disulfide-isomerase TMX3 n=1 Tax=Diaphorina citri TaxID=121845 RepID=A0A1S4ECK6_DIACI|nr:protein disulfide-isomerase TMX3 [Diaphorina citri]